MARGSPDYGQMQTQTVQIEQGGVNSPVFDIGFSRYNGGGRVVLFDDFRKGLYNWDASGYSGGSAPRVSLDAGIGLGLFHSVKLSVNVSGGLSLLAQKTAIPQSGKIGFEFGFYLKYEHPDVYFNFGCAFADESAPAGWAKIAKDTGVLSLRDDSGYQAIYTPADSAYKDARNLVLKVVIDPSTGKYDRVEFAGIVLSSSLSLKSSAFGGFAGCVLIGLYGQATDSTYISDVYCHYVAVSADEP